MANGQQWFKATRLRGAYGAYSHAMPAVKLCLTGTVRINTGPFCIFAQGLIVPISRGSPPISG